MISNIDPTKPLTGVDQPVKNIRDNFAIAKNEIDALQVAAGLDNGSGIITSGLLNMPHLPNINVLPLAESHEGYMIYINTIKLMIYSDGIHWRTIYNNTIIL